MCVCGDCRPHSTMMAGQFSTLLLLYCMSSVAAISRKVITPADTFPVESTHFSQVSFPHRTSQLLSPLQQAHILDDVQQHRFQQPTIQSQQFLREPVLYSQTQFFGSPSQTQTVAQQPPPSSAPNNGFQVEFQKSITDSEQIKQQLEQERIRELKALEEARLAQEAILKAYQQTTTESEKPIISIFEKNFGEKSLPVQKNKTSSTEEADRSVKNISRIALNGLRGHLPRAMTAFRFIDERSQIPVSNNIRTDTRYSPREGLRSQQPQSIQNNQDLKYNDFKSSGEKERQKQLQDQLRNQFRGQLIQRQELLKRLKQVISEPPTQTESQQIPELNVLPTNSSFPLILADGQKLQFIQAPGGNIPLQLANGGNFDIKSIVVPSTQAASTPSPKQQKILFEDITKGVLPPGAQFEVIRQKQDGGLEEVGKIPQDLPEKKVTFVFLEEQPDGTVKVQGVRGSSDVGSGDSKTPAIDVESIIKKFQEGNLKTPPVNKIVPGLQEIQLTSTNIPGNTPQESINSHTLVAQASSNSLSPSTNTVNNYQTTPSTQTRSPSVSYFATTNNILLPENHQNHQSTHTPITVPVENPKTPIAQPVPTVHNQQSSSVPSFISNSPVFTQSTADTFSNPTVNTIHSPNPPAPSQVHDQQVLQLQQGSPSIPQQPQFNGHNQIFSSPAPPIPQTINSQYTTALFPSNHQPAATFPSHPQNNNHNFLPTVSTQADSFQSFPASPNSIAPTIQQSPTNSQFPVSASTYESPVNFVGHNNHNSHKDVNNGVVKKRQKNRFRTTHTSTTVLPEFEEDEIKVEPKPPSPNSLTQIMKEEGLFAMARFLKESGLDDVLNDTGPYTIFVPTDKAFRSLLVQLGGPEKADEKFKENPRLLSGLLLHHVIPGAFPLESLQDEMTGVSLAGTQLRVNTYYSQDVEWNNVKVVAINGARISRDKHDIEIPQGVAHAIDRVMFPLPVGNLLQTLQTDREHRFTKFLRVLQAADLTVLLAGSKVHTLFAPTDRAFSVVSPADLERIVSDKELSQALVQRHLSQGTLYTAGMRFFQIRDSLERGQTVTINKTGGQVKVNNAKVLTHNIPATNGVVHVIDGLL